MRHTYVADDNSSGDAQVLGESGQDVRVYTVVVGTPVDAGTVTLFNKRVAYTGDTDNIACVLTVPTAAEGKNWQQVYEFGPEGLPLDGGSFHIDQDMDVTVVWEPEEERE